MKKKMTGLTFNPLHSPFPRYNNFQRPVGSPWVKQAKTILVYCRECPSGHVRETKQAFLWYNEVVFSGSVYSACVCACLLSEVCVGGLNGGPECGLAVAAGACSCANSAPCHPSRRKKSPSVRSWRKYWRRITGRSPTLRPSWYALRQHPHSIWFICYLLLYILLMRK